MGLLVTADQVLVGDPQFEVVLLQPRQLPAKKHNPYDFLFLIILFILEKVYMISNLMLVFIRFQLSHINTCSRYISHYKMGSDKQ